jgi:Tol biopolymer transport system component
VGLVPLALAVALLAGCGGARSVTAPKHFRLVYLNGDEVIVASVHGTDAHTLGPGSQALLAPSGTVVGALVAGGGDSQSLRIYQTLRRPRPRVVAQFGASKWLSGETRLLAWSPDSRYVALTATALSGGGEQPELLVVNVVSGRVAVIAAGYFFGASFAPKLPDRLAYSRASVEQLDSGGAVLFTAQPDGRDARAITTSGLDEDPAWGAKGIVFARLSRLGTTTSGPRYQLWIVQPTGRGLRQLTHIVAGRPATGSARAPLGVSADGTHIVANFFSAHSFSAIDVWAVDIERRRIVVRLLGFGGARFVAQGISSDGRSILVSPAGEEAPAAQIETRWWHGSTLTPLVSVGSDPSWNH